MPRLRSLLFIAAGLSLFLFAAGSPGIADAAAAPAPPGVSSLTCSPITIYGAKWCSACRALEGGLNARKIPFEVIDVEANPAAFARARAESGSGGAIPLTSVVTSSKTVWIVGADVDAVDRAQRGE